MAHSKEKTPGAGHAIVSFVRKDPVGTISLVVVVTFVVLALMADVVAPYGLTETQFSAPKQAPTAAHLLGTDELSRDILSRMLYASRISLFIGFVPTSINIVIGTLVGILSALSSKSVDTVIMRIVDVILSFPFMILAMAIVYNLGASTMSMFLALILVGWANTARVVRGQTMLLSKATFVEAARSMGVPTWKIMFEHIIPNIAPMLLVLYTMSIPQAILSEAGLSFLGFGAQPPATSLGLMVAQGRKYLFNAPWISLAPAIYILIVSLALNFLGDSLRSLVSEREGAKS